MPGRVPCAVLLPGRAAARTRRCLFSSPSPWPLPSPSTSSSSSSAPSPSCSRTLSSTRARRADSPAQPPPPPPPAASGDTSHGSKRAAPLPSSSSSTSSATAAQPPPRLRPRDRLQWIEDKNGSVIIPAAPPDLKGKGKERDPHGGSPAATGLPGSKLADDEPPVALSSEPAPTSSSSSSSDHVDSSPPPPPPPPPPTEIVIQAPVPGLPPLEAHQLPLRRVPFSTRKFVRDLEQAGIERPMAETVMRATRELLTRQEGKANQAILNRQDLENEAYLFQAALAELKTGSQVKLRNDSITLRSLTANLQRETDGLEQKMKEDMQRLSSDIQLEMNARKEETATELQSLDKRVMDLNSKFTILLSEVRTEIEATKWVSTRRVMTAITITVVLLVAYFSATNAAKAREQAGAGMGPDGKKKKKPSIPSIEELGVQPTDAEAEALLASEAAGRTGGSLSSTGGGWAFWGQGAPAQATGSGLQGGKRIGSEGEDE
ncbi:hypothetical protein JCM3774_000660 [Rhodotorula dairenensis]